MRRLLYTFVVLLLLPWAFFNLHRRGRKQPGYRQHWQERLGRYVPLAPRPTLWIHAVSVGETRAAQPLVAALRERYPGHRILLTHMTPTGRATAGSLFQDTVHSVYLPYDLPWLIERFLRHFRPRLGLLMETELWPNLIATCRRQGIPLLLVNARLSEKSARRYARLPNLTRTALRELTAIAAIDADDAVRLERLGAADVRICGNVKFDTPLPAHQPDLKTLIGERPLLLCASTREGEEALILDAWKNAAIDPACLLLIVPRHPARCDDLAREIAARGFSLQRRSENRPVAAATRVWLGDSLGEMFAYYEAAAVHGVAFVGGSLLDFGCQNLIEPCRIGTPVLLGPSTFNFSEAAAAALAAGAARQVADATALVATTHALLRDAAQRRAMGAAGRAFADRHRGATQCLMTLIERHDPSLSEKC